MYKLNNKIRIEFTHHLVRKNSFRSQNPADWKKVSGFLRTRKCQVHKPNRKRVKVHFLRIFRNLKIKFEFNYINKQE